MKTFFIHTFGCQMNVSDSDRMSEQLAKVGFRKVDEPTEADVILLNTCAVREKAVQKVLSALGRYKKLKNARGTILGVTGCIAQQEKRGLLQKVPYLDLVLGTDAIGRLPEVVAQVERTRARIAETQRIDSGDYLFLRAEPDTSRGRASEFVTVMKGCDHVCAYCIVPYTRGPEMSRPVDEVMAELRSLASVGVREVTLLGQNVNSYAGGCDFPELLERACDVEGIERVRFSTSNPHDLSDRLADAFRRLSKLMPSFHLPVQSGSNRILERMRRGYTVETYRARVEALRAARPGIALTTDIIVGFPGETDEDFEATYRLCDELRFESLFSFPYSPRPHTAAAIHEKEWGEVPHELKSERLQRLQERGSAIALDYAKAQLGRQVEVLVEGPSKQEPTRRFGRTPENRVVNFEGNAETGRFARVEILEASPHNLLGKELP